MADSEARPGLPEGVTAYEVAAMSFAAKDKILRQAREILTHVEADSPPVGERDARVIELAHSVADLEDAASASLQDHAQWLRAVARHLEALVELKKEGMIG